MKIKPCYCWTCYLTCKHLTTTLEIIFEDASNASLNNKHWERDKKSSLARVGRQVYDKEYKEQRLFEEALSIQYKSDTFEHWNKFNKIFVDLQNLNIENLDEEKALLSLNLLPDL